MKKKLATVWLDGCSGCHMSFLDMDERLIDLSDQFELVYSPFVDHKVFPETVDISLVEGSVSTDADEHKIRLVREHTAILVALGDCAVTGNVPSMRNAFTVDSILERVSSGVTEAHKVLFQGLPTLLPHVRPVHELVKVDVFVPGCPPSADTIYRLLGELLAGTMPDLARLTRFGA
jgi:NAD-reducing hydrogenase small subunit